MNKQLPYLLKDYLNQFFKVLSRPLDNLKTRKAMKMKFLGYFIYAETTISLLLHDCMTSPLIK